MYKTISTLMAGLLLSSVAIAKPLTSYAVLNGSYIGEGAPMYRFDGTNEAGISEGQACQYGGTLTQPNKNKLVFIYKNQGSDGSIKGCSIAKPLKIAVIATDPKTGVATKIKVTATSKRDDSFAGVYEPIP